MGHDEGCAERNAAGSMRRHMDQRFRLRPAHRSGNAKGAGIAASPPCRRTSAAVPKESRLVLAASYARAGKGMRASRRSPRSFGPHRSFRSHASRPGRGGPLRPLTRGKLPKPCSMRAKRCSTRRCPRSRRTCQALSHLAMAICRSAAAQPIGPLPLTASPGCSRIASNRRPVRFEPDPGLAPGTLLAPPNRRIPTARLRGVQGHPSASAA